MALNLEAAVISYLKTAFDDTVPVFAERPMNSPGTYLLVEKTGGSVVNMIETSSIAIQSIAPTKYTCAELSEDVKSVMPGLPAANADVTFAVLSADYDNTDTATKDYRYQVVFEITHY